MQSVKEESDIFGIYAKCVARHFPPFKKCIFSYEYGKKLRDTYFHIKRHISYKNGTQLRNTYKS